MYSFGFRFALDIRHGSRDVPRLTPLWKSYDGRCHTNEARIRVHGAMKGLISGNISRFVEM